MLTPEPWQERRNLTLLSDQHLHHQPGMQRLNIFSVSIVPVNIYITKIHQLKEIMTSPSAYGEVYFYFIFYF